ncbi:hypothetical protein VNO77_34299 [Canavalia gladiata]|uniref:Uncharacterized protein n=1 Tax=Canavalia gladiata TaxID=3824 RepID=A0AAN9KHB2_CANGL
MIHQTRFIMHTHNSYLNPIARTIEAALTATIMVVLEAIHYGLSPPYALSGPYSYFTSTTITTLTCSQLNLLWSGFSPFVNSSLNPHAFKQSINVHGLVGNCLNSKTNSITLRPEHAATADRSHRLNRK